METYLSNVLLGGGKVGDGRANLSDAALGHENSSEVACVREYLVYVSYNKVAKAARMPAFSFTHVVLHE